jgi:hypothetical protein
MNAVAHGFSTPRDISTRVVDNEVDNGNRENPMKKKSASSMEIAFQAQRLQAMIFPRFLDITDEEIANLEISEVVGLCSAALELERAFMKDARV